MKSHVASPLLAALGAAALVLSGCSAEAGDGRQKSHEKPASSDTANALTVEHFDTIKTNKSVKGLLPKDFNSMTVVSAQGSRPTSFTSADGDSVLGLNPDIARALGRVMGVKVKVVLIPFDGVIPGLQSGKYTAAIASMSPSADRLKVLDMISYTLGGSAIVVPHGNPDNLTSKNLCGLRVAVQAGSYQAKTRLPDLNKETCTNKSKPKIKSVNIPDPNEGLLALSSGRVDAYMGDAPVVGYALKTRGDKFQVIKDDSNLKSVGGIAVKKGSKLTPGLIKAMAALRELPEYKHIYKKWNVPTLMLPQKNLGKMKSEADGVVRK